LAPNLLASQYRRHIMLMRDISDNKEVIIGKLPITMGHRQELNNPAWRII
jgi:hypothetical protein